MQNLYHDGRVPNDHNVNKSYWYENFISVFASMSKETIDRVERQL